MGCGRCNAYIRGQLIKQLVEQALTFNPSIYTNEKVLSIAKNEDGIFVIAAESGNIHYSKTVIVAIGGGILNPQKIEIKGLNALKYLI